LHHYHMMREMSEYTMRLRAYINIKKRLMETVPPVLPIKKY